MEDERVMRQHTLRVGCTTSGLARSRRHRERRWCRLETLQVGIPPLPSSAPRAPPARGVFRRRARGRGVPADLLERLDVVREQFAAGADRLIAEEDDAEAAVLRRALEEAHHLLDSFDVARPAVGPEARGHRAGEVDDEGDSIGLGADAEEARRGPRLARAAATLGLEGCAARAWKLPLRTWIHQSIQGPGCGPWKRPLRDRSARTSPPGNARGPRSPCPTPRGGARR